MLLFEKPGEGALDSHRASPQAALLIQQPRD
jgi:hypothetical protein